MAPAYVTRAAGLMAASGGALRVVGAFVADAPAQILARLYFVTDVCFVFGLFGLYAVRASRVGALGLVGFAVAVAGFLAIRSAQALHLPYEAGAALALFGTAVFGASLVRAREGAVAAPTLWALAALGGVASAVTAAPAASLFAGVCFGLGYIVAGIAIWRAAGAAG